MLVCVRLWRPVSQRAGCCHHTHLHLEGRLPTAGMNVCPLPWPLELLGQEMDGQ